MFSWVVLSTFNHLISWEETLVSSLLRLTEYFNWFWSIHFRSSHPFFPSDDRLMTDWVKNGDGNWCGSRRVFLPPVKHFRESWLFSSDPDAIQSLWTVCRDSSRLRGKSYPPHFSHLLSYILGIITLMLMEQVKLTTITNHYEQFA